MKLPPPSLIGHKRWLVKGGTQAQLHILLTRHTVWRSFVILLISAPSKCLHCA